jgi:hypothetical protein
VSLCCGEQRYHEARGNSQNGRKLLLRIDEVEALNQQGKAIVKQWGQK